MFIVNKTIDELFRVNARLAIENESNASRADYWAREASQTSKDLASVMEDNAERRHTNLELNYKLAKLEGTNGK